MNIGTIIDAAAAGDPDRAALIVDGRTVSYGELAAAVERCAAAPGRRRTWPAGASRSSTSEACCRSRRCSAPRGSALRPR